ncbi:MAG: efflux RND transporter permease subunit [Rickettsiales bacterium]|nr:efflux RND transporter permease subunit [Rickettsiales bacterium]
MMISDICVKRPVLASVISLLLIVIGVVAFMELPLRQYPDIDPPIISVDTIYPGAAANVVETRITELVEDRIAGVEGIRSISSVSEDGRSRVTIEFSVNRDIDAAANDIRDRVSTILDDLPEEAEPSEIQKVDSNDDVIMWLNLVSDRMTVPELTDYAERYLVDRFSVLDGVARVRVGGGLTYAMRVWLDRNQLAARNLTVADIENALRQENVELPAGSLESKNTQFTLRLERSFRSAEDFSNLVIARGANGYLVRLGDVAKVEKGVEENRIFFRGNEVPMVGLGVIKQSTANTLDVTRLAKAEALRLVGKLPAGMEIKQSYDSSVFIEGAINEVYKTLAIAILLVIIVIYLFLGDIRSVIIPAVTVPISLTATFIVLYALDYSVNLLTLLALVLAIGLVVDDAIVVLENIYRRMQKFGETPLVAAFRGTREISFAVISTSLVLVSVFVPLAFLEGDIGRLFSEFAVTMAAAVGFSSLVALTLTPVIASFLLKQDPKPSIISQKITAGFTSVQNAYGRQLGWVLRHPRLMFFVLLSLLGFVGAMLSIIPSEYAPKEDRGAFFVLVNGPEGASYDYMTEYMDEIEARMMPYVESEEFTRLLVRAPRSFGSYESFNSGIVIVVLNDWSKRRDANTIMNEVRGKLADLPGVRAFPVMRQGFGGRIQKPVQFVIGGGTYEVLAGWRDTLIEQITQQNPGFLGIDSDYKQTKPQLQITIDYNRAAELGVTVSEIGRTLETMMGSRKVTTYIEAGEEYDVIVEGERAFQSTPTSIENIYIRSSRGNALIPLSNLVFIKEFADSPTLNRYNRVRAITIEANLQDGYTLGEALAHLEGVVAEHLPEQVIIDYKGQSEDFQSYGSSIFFTFLMGLLIVYLVLAAQFESYVHPITIMLTVPLAIAGALAGMALLDVTMNIYTRIGLIMLVGLAAKNGILIVEFANQLRDQGKTIPEALREASLTRLRPIVMTGITTAAGSIPLVLAFGPGAETRAAIGIVILFGAIAATLFTLFAVPVAYQFLARFTSSPEATARKLEKESE